MRHGSDLPGFMKVKEADTQKADRVELASSFQSTSDKPEPVPSADHVKGVDTDVVKLVLSPTRVDCGKAINVEWQHSAEPTSRDWIALYLEGKSGKEYVTYEWVSQRKGTSWLLAVFNIIRTNIVQCPSYLRQLPRSLLH